MNKLVAVISLSLVLFFSGCIQNPLAGKAEGPNYTTNNTEKIVGEKKESVNFISEGIVRANLAKSEEVKLFLGLYPAADISLRKVENPAKWTASYVFGTKNLTFFMDPATGDIEATTIPVDYLKSGKYCKVSSDCVNIGDINSALCINNIYAQKDGAVCDPKQVACSRGIECCRCVQNYCAKREVFVAPDQCPAAKNGTSGASASSASSSSTASCGSINELSAGKKVKSGNKTMELVGIYRETAGPVAKFTVTSDTGTATKFVDTKSPQYLEGVVISVSDIILSVSGGKSVVMLSLSGMGETCTIS